MEPWPICPLPGVGDQGSDSLLPQVGTGLPSPMSFAHRVQNVVTYAAVSLIDYFAFHRWACLGCRAVPAAAWALLHPLQGIPLAAHVAFSVMGLRRSFRAAVVGALCRT